VVIVAGAGIGGLTAALALARNGFSVVVLEQAERLEETGAGIQLTPNATRTLIDLGLAERLRPSVTVPQALRVLSAASGREILRMPLGEAAALRYSAPYWVIHRGDLQSALAGAAAQRGDITLKLGVRVDDFVAHPGGITVSARSKDGLIEERGLALLAADGLWSGLRKRLGHAAPPRFAGRTAWRGVIPADRVPSEFREPLIHLWFGSDAHLVHYPVKAGGAINVVVITADGWNMPGWSAPASKADIIARLAAEAWAPPARALLALPETWLKWALFDCPPLRRWSLGPAALIGDAAHAMLPYLAQGAAMAIEDAAVAAQCLAQNPENPAAALATYYAVRRARVWKVQRLAARNGDRYHFGGAKAALRNAAMRVIGGTALLYHYDWIYDWRPPPTLSIG
jgi:salicylate hydroxylase